MMEETKPRHSRLGIASFITAIAVGILVPLDMVASAALMWSMQGEDASKFIPLFIAMGFILILAYGGNLAGIGLGIAGIRQKDRNRVFAIIGLCLATAIVQRIVIVTQEQQTRT